MAVTPGSAGGGTPATLTLPQIIALWLKAGGSITTAPMAAARAMAESSGQVAVTSSNPDGGTNVGVWQLDTRGVGAGHTQAELEDPLTNAQITVQATRDGADWSEWADNWQQFIGSATSATRQFQASGASHPGGIIGFADEVLAGWEDIGRDATGAAGGVAANLLSLPSQVTGFFSALEAPVQGLMWLVNPANWVRILAGMFGFLLLGAGLIALGKAA